MILTPKDGRKFAARDLKRKRQKETGRKRGFLAYTNSACLFRVDSDSIYIFLQPLRCTLYFTCSIEKSSAFQCSKKLGKITCQFPKKQDGTVGELVLRNPAPIPFHFIRCPVGRLHLIHCECIFYIFVNITKPFICFTSVNFKWDIRKATSANF